MKKKLKKILILIGIIINSINSEFGFVLNNCSDLFVSCPKKNNNFSNKFILSEEGFNLKLRTAQANYGEILEINELKNNKDYYLVKSDLFFYSDKNEKLNNSFFIEKKNIKILNTNKLEIYKNSILSHKKAFLKKSYKNFLIGKMFFINEKEKNSKIINCYFFDENLNKNFINIHKSYLEIRDKIYHSDEFIKKNNKNIRSKIINFLKSLTKNKNKIVPYIFGGTTIGRGLSKNFFEKKIINLEEKKIVAYIRKSKYIKKEMAGLDCSALVNLSLRLFGIPFFLRNTKLFSKYLKQINSYENLEDGDLLWIPGHIFILDKKNEIIYESGGYKSGLNGIKGTHISKRIKNIKSIQDLFFVKNFSFTNNKKIINKFLFLKSF